MRAWVLGRRLTAGYVIAALAVLVAGWAGFNQIVGAREAGDAARHAQTILSELANLDIDILDAETGQRGYLLTGNESYLAPFDRGRKAAVDGLDRLSALAADSPLQQQRLERLSAVVNAKLAELAKTVEIRRTQGLEPALALVQTHVGKATMDQIRALLAEASQEERAILDRRLDRRGSRFWWAGRVTLLASALALAVVVISTLAVNRNVRRRAETDRQLRESRERLAVTLQSIGDAVIATDPSGKTVFMNQVAADLTGWALRDSTGRPLEEVFHIVNEQTREAVESPVTKVLRSGTVVGLANHTVLIRRDGSDIPIDDSGAPIRDGDGEIMGVVLVFRDASARKVQEETVERLRVEEMARLAAESASRTKDEFLAILSHELRSPLQGIVGWLTVLSQPGIDPNRQRQAIQSIERGVRQQTQLVNDILDSSRIVAGKLRIERDSVTLAPLVHECLEELLPLAREKQIVLESKVEECGTAIGDRHRLYQSLSNIIANAIKFTPSGGRIEVVCGHDGEDALITVTDTGEGIEADFLPYIFDRFTQGKTRARRTSGGLGLGLSIVHQIIEAHGGRVNAASAGFGMGSTFTLRVPAAMPEGECELRSESAAASEGVADGLSSLSILVVDDDVETREPLALLLAMRGAEVAQAESVAMALDLLGATPFDAVVSDIAMPGQDGYALIRALPEKGSHGRPITIALTGFASAEDRQRANAAGFDAHVAKPFDFDVLAATIASLTRRRPGASA